MAKAGKLKSGGKAKLKRWKKGQSSSSNPELRKHREKARAKFFHVQPTSKSNKGLTLEALKIHDEMQESRDVANTTVDDTESAGGETFKTFLSGLSDCTNVTFRKIQRYWQSNSAKHKEVCAVIAAITEVIRQQGGAESDTAYFAALVTALDSVESAESLAAVAYLLSMTCKKVPEAVLRAKFSEVSKLLTEVLSTYANKPEGAPAALVRSLILCLATLLRNQSLETWSAPSTMNVYQMLLSLSCHSKPKIRKAAQNGVCAILKASTIMTSSAPPQYHPAAPNTAKFCVQAIEKSGTASADNNSHTCHIVSLLGEIVHCFPASALKLSCETILKRMTLSQPIVKSVCLQALYNLFKNHPKPDHLSLELNAQIMTALYDYQPTANDFQLLKAWLTVMEEAMKNLTSFFEVTEAKSDVERIGIAHMNKLVKTCMKIMESGIQQTSKAAAVAINTIFESCMPKFLENASRNKKGNTAVLNAATNEIFKLLEEGLKYKYHTVWDHVFGIFYTAYRVLASRTTFPLIKSSISSMADLRNTPLFPHKVALDKALGAAIEALGPELFLEAVPLLIDGTETDYDFPRSWILPLFRNHVKNTEIKFFTSYFLPLASKLQTRGNQLREAAENTAATPYETLHYQIWLLLPNFCDGATDISASFPTIARTLGTVITDHDQLRPIAMQALRTLILKCKNDEDKKTISRFAKNYLPILFNFYTTVKPTEIVDVEMENEAENLDASDLNKKKSPERLAALETIRLYLPLADQKLVCMFFQKAKKRIFDGKDENDATRLALLDLLISMALYIDKETLSDIYQDLKPMLNSPNHSMQKKAYRLLEEVCGSESAECRAFVETKLSEIKALLTDGLTAASPSAKGPRLKCMERVLKLLATNEKYSAEECIAFMRDFIPEVIMCTREKKRARVAAFSLLITAGNVYCEIASRRAAPEKSVEEMKKEALTEYFQIPFAGLGGSPISITASICALSRMVFEYKGDMSSELLNTCIKNVCILLGTNTREVCKAALGFVTVLLTILDRSVLAQHVKDVLGALFEWKSETRRHFRFKVKKMLERFVKKFGYEMIYSLVPPDHRKQLANLRKTKERMKRQRQERSEKRFEEMKEERKESKPESIEELLADSDSEDDDEQPKAKSNKAKSQSGAWLKDSQDEPMNLLEQGVSQQIIATNPHKQQKKEKPDAFRSAPDGRLIIGEESDHEQDVENVLANLGIKKGGQSQPKTGQKRKVTFNVEDDQSDEEPSYKKGGMGIHRDIGEAYRSKKAKGDVKRQGMPDPYAYIPLNKSTLNKRKKKKLQGQFKGLVRAAKHGAVKGNRMKSKAKK